MFNPCNVGPFATLKLFGDMILNFVRIFERLVSCYLEFLPDPNRACCRSAHLGPLRSFLGNGGRGNSLLGECTAPESPWATVAVRMQSSRASAEPKPISIFQDDGNSGNTRSLPLPTVLCQLFSGTPLVPGVVFGFRFTKCRSRLHVMPPKCLSGNQ